MSHSFDVASEIIPGLFVSNASHARRHGKEYDLVINVTTDIAFDETADESQTQIRLAVLDDPSDNEALARAIRSADVMETIQRYLDDGKRVLVHCWAGVQRSPAVVASFLMQRRGMCFEDAVWTIKTMRPVAFFGSVTFERMLREEIISCSCS